MSQFVAGKDYSNARVSDFYALDKPDEDMYDRSKIPRMPWYCSCFIVACKFPLNVLFRHDVSMQVLGQPARDLARHFVERSVLEICISGIFT
jgi:phospholipase D1/2